MVKKQSVDTTVFSHTAGARRQAQRAGAATAAAALLASTWGAGASSAQAVYPTDVVNIAAAQNGGRVVSVSSTIDNDPAFNANNLIDGQVTSAARPRDSAGWVSNRFDPIAMETITLGFKDNAPRLLGKIVLNPATAVAPERWAKDIEVQVSSESAEGPFRPIAQVSLRKTAEPQEFKFVPVQARYVRLMFRSNWGSDRAVGLGEVEVYEAIGQSDPMGLVIAQLEGAVQDLRRYRQTLNEGNATAVAARPLKEATVQLIRSQGASVQRVQNGVEAQRGRVNIASTQNGGKIVDSSSQFISDPAQGADPAYKPENLIDGQNLKPDGTGSQGWASQGFVPGQQFVTIGFADDRTRLVSKFVINPVSGQSDLRWARRIDVQVTTESPKNGPWRTVSTINLRPEAVNQDFSIRPVEAKYVRFVFQANGPGGIAVPNADPDVNSDRAVSLGEIEIYEAPASSEALDGLISRFEQVLLSMKNLRQTSKPTQARAVPAKRKAPMAKRS
jgi:hypothetical protein